jgi:hypothetical protein
MRCKPQFSFFVSHGNAAVTPHSAIWQHPLPLDRSLLPTIGDSSVTYGEYFTAVQTILENAGCELISRAIDERLGPQIKPAPIRKIQVNLEKHGEFYHPSHLLVLTRQGEISFVLNVAVSETGLRHITDEYNYLQKLNNEFTHSFLPEVYGIDEGVSAGNRRIGMFLGQWFEGYHEFHLSRNPTDGTHRIAVWHPGRSRVYLSPEQTQDLYRQVARILAYYYNVETFCQIFPWHHAAGDFIVRVEDADLDVKLITVRSYMPLLNPPDSAEDSTASPELILQALLIFFLSLSIRTRLDRLEGVGDLAWADASVVGPTLTGFMEGLALKPPVRSMPDRIERCFHYYLSVCTRQDLCELIHGIANTHNPDSFEYRVLHHNIDEHIETLSGAVQSFIS